MTPNRIVALATAVLSLCVAVLPAIANLDWTSTAGLLTGLAGVCAVALKWLDGWQKHEGRQQDIELFGPPKATLDPGHGYE